MQSSRKLLYIEILGVTGAGKSTVLGEVEKFWREDCNWLLDPTYNYGGPWKGFDHGRPTKFLKDNCEFSAYIFREIATSLPSDDEAVARKFLQIVAISKIFKKLEMLQNLTGTDQEKVAILDEGPLLHTGLITPKTTVEQARKLLLYPIMPSGYVFVEADEATILRRLHNRKDKSPAQKSLDENQFARVIKNNIQDNHQKKGLLDLLNIPYIVIDSTQDSRKNAELIIEFAQKNREEVLKGT